MDDVRLGSGEMFDAIAARYDRMNRILSLGLDVGWRRAAVKALDLPARGRALDVATGTGDLAIAIARTHPGVDVVGVDPSGGMLGVGEAKVAAAGLGDRVSFVRGDAQALALAFAEDGFDGAAIAFGIRNVPDRARALAEMARVVRPGGRVVVLELGEPDGGVLGALARIHVHAVVPAVGAALSGKREYRYLERSIAAFPSRAAFAAMIRAAGLEVVEVRALAFGAASLFVAAKPIRARGGAA